MWQYLYYTPSKKKRTLGDIDNWIAFHWPTLIHMNMNMIQHDVTCIIQCFFVDFRHSSIAWVQTLRGSRDFRPWGLPELRSDMLAMWSKGLAESLLLKIRRAETLCTWSKIGVMFVSKKSSVWKLIYTEPGRPLEYTPWQWQPTCSHQRPQRNEV